MKVKINRPTNYRYLNQGLYTSDELLRKQECWRRDGLTARRADGRAHRQTQATKIPGGPNWPRVKTLNLHLLLNKLSGLKKQNKNMTNLPRSPLLQRASMPSLYIRWPRPPTNDDPKIDILNTPQALSTSFLASGIVHGFWRLFVFATSCAVQIHSSNRIKRSFSVLVRDS